MSELEGFPLTLDHVVLGVPELQSNIEYFERQLGVAPSFGGQHKSLGTHNAILPLKGGRYLELIASDPSTPNPLLRVPWNLDTLKAPLLITWAAATHNIDASIKRARSAGYDPGTAIEVARETPDGKQLAWRLTISSTLAGEGLVPFLIDWGESPHPSETSEAQCSIESFSAEHPEPEPVCKMLSGLGASLKVTRGARARLRATIVGPNGSIELD